MKYSISLLFITLMCFGQNPAMDGFNKEGSDPKAIEIADKVMEALGGYENWNNTKIVHWNFFGRRMHYWNKWTGDYRMEYNNKIIVMNLNTDEGKVFLEGKEETSPDSLSKYLIFTGQLKVIIVRA